MAQPPPLPAQLPEPLGGALRLLAHRTSLASASVGRVTPRGDLATAPAATAIFGTATSATNCSVSAAATSSGAAAAPPWASRGARRNVPRRPLSMSATTPALDPLAPAAAALAAATSFGTDDFSFGTDEAAPSDASHAAPRQEWQEDEEGRAVLILPHSRGVARVVVEHAPGARVIHTDEADGGGSHTSRRHDAVV